MCSMPFRSLVRTVVLMAFSPFAVILTFILLSGCSGERPDSKEQMRIAVDAVRAQAEAERAKAKAIAQAATSDYWKSAGKFLGSLYNTKDDVSWYSKDFGYIFKGKLPDDLWPVMSPGILRSTAENLENLNGKNVDADAVECISSIVKSLKYIATVNEEKINGGDAIDGAWLGVDDAIMAVSGQRPFTASIVEKNEKLRKKAKELYATQFEQEAKCRKALLNKFNVNFDKVRLPVPKIVD